MATTLEKIADPNVQRFMLATGRRYRDLGLLEGGAEVMGQMTLVNVATLRTIRLEPNEKVPEGTWIPANHIPAALLAEIQEPKR